MLCEKLGDVFNCLYFVLSCVKSVLLNLCALDSLMSDVCSTLCALCSMVCAVGSTVYLYICVTVCCTVCSTVFDVLLIMRLQKPCMLCAQLPVLCARLCVLCAQNLCTLDSSVGAVCFTVCSVLYYILCLLLICIFMRSTACCVLNCIVCA
jgi:hypothetical protein